MKTLYLILATHKGVLAEPQVTFNRLEAEVGFEEECKEFNINEDDVQLWSVSLVVKDGINITKKPVLLHMIDEGEEE